MGLGNSNLNAEELPFHYVKGSSQLECHGFGDTVGVPKRRADLLHLRLGAIPGLKVVRDGNDVAEGGIVNSPDEGNR